MDEVTKKILRSLNWPNENSYSFSTKPTAYNISKNSHLPLTSVYREWHHLFDSGIVKSILLIPSDSLINRRLVFLSGATKDDFDIVLSRINEIHFLEIIRYCRVYYACGAMKFIGNSPSCVSMDLVSLSGGLAKERATEIADFLASNVNIAVISQESHHFHLDKNLVNLVRKISYSDIIKMNIGDLAYQINASFRSIEKRLDFLLANGYMMAYPLIEQSVVKGFSIALVYAQSDNVDSNSLLMKSLNSSLILSERYLRYRIRNGIIAVLFYYDSISELEECTEELNKIFGSFALFTRFESRFNKSVEPNFY